MIKLKLQMFGTDYLTTDTELTSIADAIRTKGGTSAALTYPTGFVSAIEALSTGTDVSDTTATESDVLAGKYFHKANGSKVQGSIATKSSSDLSASGKTVTVPAGYYASQTTKDVETGSATTPATTITAQPSISVNSSGLITATNSKTQSVTPTVSEGYVSSGTAGTITVSGSNTSQLATQAAQTITPTTTDQTIASGKYLTGAQTVKGDANLVADNIAEGVTIFGVQGTHSGGGTDVSDTTAAAGDVRTGKYFYTSSGVKTEGTIADGTITNNTSGGTSSGTINRGSQIKVGAGYYASDAYYTAQGNSGTKTISTSGTTSVNGYANASVAAGTITNNTSGGTSSGTINAGAQIKIGAGMYDSDVYYQAESAIPAGSITNNTTLPSGSSSSGTVNRGSYIKIGAGSYGSDIYYRAQGNSGTKTITGSGTTSVDGYANASVASGSATTPAATVTANPSISVNSSTGVITATASATKSVTPTVSAGWVGSGTAGTITVSGSNTSQLTTQAATTYNTSSSNQEIASGKYLTGKQTIRAVTTSNISAGNIKSGVTVKVGDAGDDDRIKGVQGTFTSSSTVSSGQTAAAAGQIMSGYSAWVDGAEVKGSIGNGTITNNTSGGTSSGTINAGSQIKIGAGYYSADKYYTAQAAPSAGTITNNTTLPSGKTSSGTVNRGSYIKIGSGAYANDVYYKAQANSGTVTISGSGTTSVDGYSNASVASGAYSASVSSHSISTTPVVTGSTSGTVTNISTTIKPSGTDGTNYWTITPGGSVTTTGVSSAKGKATIGTAGWIGTGNTESSADTVNITPTVSNGTARYIKKGAITNNTSGGATSGTINRGNQIEISAGYYPDDLYYTAQANSGTLAITSSGTTSCDGYANVSVPKGAIVLSISASSNTSVTINNSNITANHYVFNNLNPDINNNISWTTSSGSLTLSCSSGIPAMTLMLCVDI